VWNHQAIWGAIDALAARHGLSASGLARKAGLDPTAFNMSKRASPDGRPRWPSTESIGKVLGATGASIDEFLALLPSARAPARVPARRAERTVPLLGLAQAGAGGWFDDGGFPEGQGWDEIAIPLASPEDAYAIEVSGDSMLPLYRAGDRLIVSPSAPIRPGDRVVVRTLAGEVMAKALKRRTARQIVLESLNPEHADRALPLKEVEWMVRILWASQ